MVTTILKVLVLLFLGIPVSAVSARELSHTGWVEKLALQPWNFEVKAKLDTGATTSSLQADDIDFFERDDEEWVRFTVEVETVDDEIRRTEVERPVVRKVRIERAGGSDEVRPVVHVEFCFDGHEREAEFTLNDRDEFLYPVLLGRKFLAGVACVDSSETFVTEPVCKHDADEPANSP